jgi:DnaJ-class molecular chaperone
MAKNYYLILGLDNDATQEQIKSAYREKAKQSHPDHSGEDSEPFLAVQEAYNVLSDPKRRRAYDRRRQVPRRRGWAGSGWPQPQRPAVEPFVSQSESGQWTTTAFESLFAPFPGSLAARFDRFWRGFSPRGRRPAGRQFDVEVTLVPDEARNGGRLRLSIPTRVKCRACRGHGRRGSYGCRHCSATGFTMEEQSLLIAVPAGIADGDTGKVALDEFGYPNTLLMLHFRLKK